MLVYLNLVSGLETVELVLEVQGVKHLCYSYISMSSSDLCQSKSVPVFQIEIDSYSQSHHVSLTPTFSVLESGCKPRTVRISGSNKLFWDSLLCFLQSIQGYLWKSFISSICKRKFHSDLIYSKRIICININAGTYFSIHGLFKNLLQPMTTHDEMLLIF